MNVTLDNIQPTALNLNKFKAIYEDSFPIEERRGWENLKSLLYGGHEFFKAYAIFHDSQFVGFITSWVFPEAVYIEHFATDAALRSSGIGSAALSQLIDSTSLPIVLEVEPAESGETAQRRIGFYRRLGFHDLPDYKYIQPPYSPDLPSIPMTLMVHGTLDPDVARKRIYKHVYEAE